MRSFLGVRDRDLPLEGLWKVLGSLEVLRKWSSLALKARESVVRVILYEFLYFFSPLKQWQLIWETNCYIVSILMGLARIRGVSPFFSEQGAVNSLSEGKGGLQDQMHCADWLEAALGAG